MGLDQIHERNNKLIKGCRGASDLLNKSEDSALIPWETYSPNIARVILDFKDCLDRNAILAESSNKHHEDSLPFYERLFTKLHKKIIATETMRTMIDDLENYD